MDRELQERVVGAIVLVVVAVLVVPVFLDGSAGEAETVSEPVILPGQGSGTPARQKIVLDRDRSEPVPANAPPPPAPAVRAEAATTPDTRDDAPRRAAAETAAAAVAASQTGMWAVQLGSFSSQENAERLAASLRKQGYAAFLSRLDSGDTPLHRVRVGPQKDRESAESVAAQLGKSGHQGQVVPHP